MSDDIIVFRKELGKRIKGLRKSKNLTQAQLGAKLDLDYQSISRIENGRTNPSSYRLKLLAQALEVDISELFTQIDGLSSRNKLQMIQFRKNIKALLKERGWTENDLAERCDIYSFKIKALETDENESLTLPTLFELARGFGIPPKQLIDYPFDFEKK